MNILKKSLLSASVALALGGGVAPETQAVQVAANGIGQVLLAPVYFARNEDERTKITLVNTNLTHAVKVKAVFRSKIHCTEVLDFLIYLTPGDVWRGEVYNKDGEAWLRSTDDSVHNLPSDSTWGNVEAADVQLFDQIMEGIDAGDVNEIGDIEFIGHYSAFGKVNVTGSDAIDIFRTMSKNELAKLFDMPVNDQFLSGGIVQANPDNCPLGQDYSALSAPTCPVRVDDTNNLRLRGNIEIVTSEGRMGYEMTALASSRVFNSNLAPIGTTNSANVIRAAVDGSGYVLKKDNENTTGLEVAGTHVISNGLLEINIATETPLGVNWGYTRQEIELSPYVFAGSIGPYDNILEIERAMSTTEVSGAYENGVEYANGGTMQTAIQLTFPTKYRHRNYDICGTGAPLVGDTSVNAYSAPFNSLGHMMYAPFSYDNFENSPPGIVKEGLSVSGAPGAAPTSKIFIFDQVNMLPQDVMEDASDLFRYESGHYQLDLFARPGCETWYLGAPAVAQTYKYIEGKSCDTACGVDSKTERMLIPASSNRWQWQ